MQVWQAALRQPYGALAALCLLLFVQGLFNLPAIDRDEARFAQASKQMLETGDFVDVRFQTEPRHKKPIGIYWLQAASARVFGAPPYDVIWPYRLPSLLGALAAVLLTFWAGRPLVGDRAALFGAALLAATLMLGAEAKLAKTDAVLLATIVAAQGALARLYLGPPDSRAPDGRALLVPVIVFWVALGAGILVKGPIPLLIAALTLVTLGLWDRDWKTLRRLQPVLGLAIVAVMVLPWAIAVQRATHGQFFADALTGDLMPKLKGGQESHGAPPGIYLALAFVTFWPGTLLLAPALIHAWRARAQAGVRFALAWAAPAWLLFELVPTKLPHYVLPLYPALALLCGAVMVAVKDGAATPLSGLWGRLAVAAWLVVTLALAGFVAQIAPSLSHELSWTGYALAALIVGAAMPVIAFAVRQDTGKALAAAIVVSVLVQASAFTIVGPRLTPLWMSTRLAALIPADAQGRRPALAASGFAEPSLVFALGTDTVLGPPADAVALLARDRSAYAAIAKPQQPAFEAEAQAKGLDVAPVATLSGLDYSTGKPVTLVLFRARSLQ